MFQSLWNAQQLVFRDWKSYSDQRQTVICSRNYYSLTRGLNKHDSLKFTLIQKELSVPDGLRSRIWRTSGLFFEEALLKLYKRTGGGKREWNHYSHRLSQDHCSCLETDWSNVPPDNEAILSTKWKFSLEKHNLVQVIVQTFVAL